MITKGKRNYLVELYRPDGFYTYKGKLCYKKGNEMFIGLVPVDIPRYPTSQGGGGVSEISICQATKKPNNSESHTMLV